MTRRIRKKSSQPERKVGERFCTICEWKGKTFLLIHELVADPSGQQWNTPVGEIEVTDREKAEEIAAWIR